MEVGFIRPKGHLGICDKATFKAKIGAEFYSNHILKMQNAWCDLKEGFCV